MKLFKTHRFKRFIYKIFKIDKWKSNPEIITKNFINQAIKNLRKEKLKLEVSVRERILNGFIKQED